MDLKTMCCPCDNCQSDLRLAAALNAAEPVIRAHAERQLERMRKAIDAHSRATAIVIPFPVVRTKYRGEL